MFKTKKSFNLINPIITGFLVFALSFALIGIQNVDAAASITIADDTINEGSEATELITVTLAGDTFVETLTPGNWAVTNLPTGVTKGTVTKVDVTHATIALVGDRTVDYDSNITNVTVTIQAAELYSSGSEVSTNTGVTLVANADAEVVTNAWAVSPGTSGAEATMNDEVVTVTLAGGTLIELQVNDTNITATGTATTAAGVTIESVTYTNATSFDVALAWDSTDYDTDKTLTINVDGAAYDEGSATTTDDIILTATVEPISIALSDDTINEGSEAAELITVTLSEDTFVAIVTSTNWAVTNLPTGVTKGDVTRTGDTTVTIALSGNRTVDYDSDITDVTVTVQAAELTISSSEVSASTGVTLVASDDAESIAITDDGTIAEGSEDTEVITVTLTGGTFADPLVPGNWVVTNLPTGVTAGNPSRSSSTVATITLSGNRTVDYDSDITNLTVTVAAADVDDSDAEVSIATGVTFTATADAESIGAAWAAAPGTNGAEATLDADKITVTLTDGTFVQASIDDITISAGSGITKESVSYTDSTHVDVLLVWDGTDFDTKETITVSVPTSAYADSSGGSAITDTIDAVASDDAESIAIASDGEILEGAEDGEVITITLTGGTFTTPLVPANWVVANLPTGVATGTVSRVSATSATIALSGNRTVDYDTSITNLTVTIAAADVDDSDTEVTKNTGVTFTATADAESVENAWVGDGAEATMDAESVTVTLTGGTLIEAQVNGTNITASGTATTDAGVTIESVAYVNATSFTVALAWDGTDYDVNKALTITVAGAAYDEGAGDIDDEITLTATVEEPLVTLSDDTINEGSEATELITISVVGDTFTGVLDSGNWAVTNLPTGVTKGDVTRTGDTTVTIALSGNRTVDYDTSITNVTVTIEADQFVTYGSQVVVNTGVTLVATDDAESIAIASDGNITEGAEAGEVITVTLTGGTFIASLNSGNWVVTNLPTGVTAGAPSRSSSTEATITLSGNRSVDYDVDITNLTLTIAAADVDDSDAEVSIATGVTFTANIEAASIVIADDTIEEGSEATELITVTLSEDTFVETLTQNNWAVTNLPTGVTKGTVTRTGDTTATIALVGDRTVDYDSDITNVTVTVQGAEFVTYSNEASANTGVTFTATVDGETVTAAWVGDGAEATMDDESVTITLAGGTLIEAGVTTGNITATGTAVDTAGVTIESVTYTDATHFNVALAWDGTDYDVEKTLTINVAGDAYDEGSSAITDDIALTANVEPTVTIVASDVAIYDDDAGVDVFTIEATFSGAMATGTIPTVTFDSALDTTLTNPTGAWSVGDTVYTWTYDIVDAGVEVADVDVTVDGGKNGSDIDQEAATETDYIDVDTLNPTVALTYTYTKDATSVSSSLYPGESITITATFNEAVDEGVVPTIAIDTPSDDITATNMSKTSGTVWYYPWSVPGSTNPEDYGIATSTIVATDIAGNDNATATNNTIRIDSSTDQDAPTFSSSYPANGATGVAISDIIPYIQMSESMDIGTVSSSTVQLRKSSDNSVVSNSATFALQSRTYGGDTIAILLPSGSLAYETDYYLYVGTGVADLGGNELADAYGSSSTTAFTTIAEGIGSFGIVSSTMTKMTGTADNSYANGWEWTVRITLPTNQNDFALKFNDWVSGLNTLAVASNMQYYSEQIAAGTGSSASPITITAANTYPSNVTVSTDVDATLDGIQTDVHIKVKIPATTSDGSYSTSYRVNYE